MNTNCQRTCREHFFINIVGFQVNQSNFTGGEVGGIQGEVEYLETKQDKIQEPWKEPNTTNFELGWYPKIPMTMNVTKSLCIEDQGLSKLSY